MVGRVLLGLSPWYLRLTEIFTPRISSSTLYSGFANRVLETDERVEDFRHLRPPIRCLCLFCPTDIFEFFPAELLVLFRSHYRPISHT